MGFFYAALNI